MLSYKVIWTVMLRILPVYTFTLLIGREDKWNMIESN